MGRQRPPLTKRLRPRHWILLDFIVAGLFGVLLFVSLVKGERTDAYSRHVPIPGYGPPLGLLLVLVAAAAVALRRRRPVLMLGILLGSSMIATALTGSSDKGTAYLFPVAYVLYLVAATDERKNATLRVLGAIFATIAMDALLMMLAGGGSPDPGAMIFISLVIVIIWCVGNMVKQRRRYAVRLQDQAASKAVTVERLRIARELHDVVAHSMSVIAVQAGYGQYVIDSQPADARAALGAIQATSREALEEMRRMLGALRQADENAAAADKNAAAADGADAGVVAAEGQGNDTGDGPETGVGASERQARPSSRAEGSRAEGSRAEGSRAGGSRAGGSRAGGSRAGGSRPAAGRHWAAARHRCSPPPGSPT